MLNFDKIIAAYDAQINKLRIDCASKLPKVEDYHSVVGEITGIEWCRNVIAEMKQDEEFDEDDFTES